MPLFSPPILAAAPAEAASQATGPAKVVSPLVVSPKAPPPPIDARVDVAGDDTGMGQSVSVWPAGAYGARAHGKVVLSCRVDAHGLAEWCRVYSEAPEGKGFGAAALALRPTFKLTPAQGPDGRPATAMMNIAVDFKPPDTQFDLGLQTAMPSGGNGGIDASNMSLSGNPAPMRRVTIMNRPVWTRAPGFDDLARAYPAKGGGEEGYVVAHCEVLRSGAVDRCVAAKTLPTGHGFARAALSLARMFRVSPEVMAHAPRGAPVEVDIPIRLPPPAAIGDRRVDAPMWLAGFDPDAAPKLFPPEAAARGLTTGRGVARCRVEPDGGVSECAPEAGDPDGLGFSEAAAKLASTMRMNLWSADGAPVSGGVVRVAIRLNLEGAK